MKKKDTFLIGGILIVVLISFLINNIINSKGSSSIEIYVNGELYEEVSINKDKEIRIENNNGYNIVKIHDKGVEIIDASCPDKVCVHTGLIDKPSKSIVCIPNKVNIKIKTNDKDNTKEDIISN